MSGIEPPTFGALPGRANNCGIEACADSSANSPSVSSKQRRDATAFDSTSANFAASGRVSGGPGGGHLPVASIQSVKVVRRRNRDHLPKAYEIFTDRNRKLLVKPVGDEDVEGWVRQLQYFVARNQTAGQHALYGMPPPAMDLGSSQNTAGTPSRPKQSCL